jgi:hypothetical protein
MKAVPPSALKELLLDGTVWFGSEERHCVALGALRARFGIEKIDGSLLHEGLLSASVHELALSTGEIRNPALGWHAPLSFTALLLRNFLEETLARKEERAYAPPIVWIGRKCFPTPALLDRLFLTEAIRAKSDWHWSTHCIFVEARTKKEKLWSALETLRSQAVLAAVLDGSGLEFLSTRRLQLAANKGGSLALVLRPEHELGFRSAAQTKWSFSPLLSPGDSPRWQIRLLRAPGLLMTRSWNIEWNEDDTEKNPLALLSDADGGSDDAVAAAEDRRRA